MAPKGYAPAKAVRRRRLVVGVEGMEKEGKTEFGLSAPGPIALLDLDIGLEGVVDKWVKSKKIYVASFNYRDVTDPDEWEKMWGHLKEAWLDGLADREVKTVAIDTGTEMWELARLAHFGKLDQVMPHKYGPVNAEMRDLIKRVYDTDKNLVITHKMKSQYVDDKDTGRMIRSGFGDMPYLMQVNLRVWRREAAGEQKKKGKGEAPKLKGQVFGMTVLDCRQNPEVMGEEVEEPMSNFATLATMVYPETKEEDWS